METFPEKGRLAKRGSPIVSSDIYIKGVTVRFGFDMLELRNFKQEVKSKATGAPYEVYSILPLAVGPHRAVAKGCLYMHPRGAIFVARFDFLGIAKALTCGTSDRVGSTFSVYMPTIYIFNNRKLEPLA